MKTLDKSYIGDLYCDNILMTTDNLDITRLKLTLRCIRYTERTASEFKCSMPIECQKKIIHSKNYGMVEFICVIYLLFANNNNLRKNFYIVTFKDGWREGNRASLRAFGLVYPQNNNRWWERSVMHSPQKRVTNKGYRFLKATHWPCSDIVIWRKQNHWTAF